MYATCLSQTLNCVERTRPTTHDYDACSTDLGARCEKLWRPRHLLFCRVRRIRCHIYLAIGKMGLEAVEGRWCRSILWTSYSKQRDKAQRIRRTDVTCAYIKTGCCHNVSYWLLGSKAHTSMPWAAQRSESESRYMRTSCFLSSPDNPAIGCENALGEWCTIMSADCTGRIDLVA